MKHQVNYNESTILEYEHHLLNTSNAATGAKYLTKLWLFVPPSSRYALGEDFGKLDDDQVKILFEETLSAKEREKEYGQRTHTDRKLLSPIRDRGHVGTLQQRISHKARPR